MGIFLALIAIVLSLVFLFLRYQFSYWHRRGISHNAPEFFYGNVREWRKSKHIKECIDPTYFKYKGRGPFAGFFLFFKPWAIATDMDFIRNVLIKDFNNFDDRGVFHNARDDPLTCHLFSLDGEKWRGLRQKLSKTFTSGKMKFMFPTVLKIGEEFAAVVDEKVSQTDNATLEMTELLARFTSDVIGSCAFGIHCNSLRNPQAEFVTMGKKYFVNKRHNKLIDGLIQAFPEWARMLRMRQIHQSVHEFYMGIVKDTVEYREKHHVRRNDFMTLLIDLKNTPVDSLTINEIAAQAFVFFLAGFETSSTTMGFALYELAKNPEIQQKLRQNINEILAKHNNQLTYESIQEMRYLDQVIAETLRKYPVVTNLVRRAKSHYVPSDPKYYLEKGDIVIIPVSAIHYDPEYYSEPDRFDPERFTDEEIKKRPACSYLPFGDGPRNCIGFRFGKMQAAIGLAYLIKNFHFGFGEQTSRSLKWNCASLLLNALGGIHLKLEKCT